MCGDTIGKLLVIIGASLVLFPIIVSLVEALGIWKYVGSEYTVAFFFEAVPRNTEAMFKVIACWLPGGSCP